MSKANTRPSTIAQDSAIPPVTLKLTIPSRRLGTTVTTGKTKLK